MKKLYFLFFTMFLATSATFAQVVINEIDADTPGTDMAEFIELKGTPNASLNGYVVVLYNGSNDTSYAAFDLDGKTLDANGFFILGNAGIISGDDIDIGASNALQNGADAVAIYTGDDTDFPAGTAVTSTNLVDAIVYGTADGDDAELLAGLGETVQYDESANGANSTESLQLNTAGDAYETKVPTFRAENDAAVCDLSLTTTSATCDAVTAGTDTYTATLDFTGGGTSTYTVMADSGTVDLTMGDPSVDASGTITVTGLTEGTDVTITVQDGGLCDLSSMITAAVCEPSNSLPLYEGFDYTVGTDIATEANWELFSGTDNPIDVIADNLSYPDFAASTGNAINVVAGFQDDRLLFNEVTSGDVYASFLLKVTDVSSITDPDGGYFALFASTSNSFRARFWVKPTVDETSTTVDFTYTAGSTGTGFGQTQNLNDVVLVVLSYNVDSGVMNAWINPSSTDFGAMSAPTADFTDTDGTANTIDRFILRQDSTTETPDMVFDELRIGTTWAEVTPSTLSTNDFNLDQFSLYPNPTNTGFVTISSSANDAISVQVFDILGKQVKNETLANNTLDVSNLKTGVYIVKISQNNASTTKKLVIR